jgi:hypothetical protein
VEERPSCVEVGEDLLDGALGRRGERRVGLGVVGDDQGRLVERGRPVMAAWDPCLTEAMLEVGVKVEEERVLGDLLADLEGRAR